MLLNIGDHVLHVSDPWVSISIGPRVGWSKSATCLCNSSSRNITSAIISLNCSRELAGKSLQLWLILTMILTMISPQSL